MITHSEREELVSLSVILKDEFIVNKLDKSVIENMLDRFQELLDKLTNYYRITNKSSKNPLKD